MLAWQRLLDPKRSEERKRKLRHHFYDSSAYDLPDLTRAFLNISGKDFYDVLAATPRSAIDDTDSGGRTILAWAAYQEDEHAVKALLACGADPNHRDVVGLTPLHMSIDVSTPECLQLLLNARADIHIKTNRGEIALNRAVRVKDEPDFLELLLAHGAEIECSNNFHWTPLRSAAKLNHTKQVSLLLGKGANINASTPKGSTALHDAIAHKSSAVLKILLNNPGLDYECTSESGSNAIILAAKCSDLETLNVLQAANLTNIDVDAVDSGGYTALDIARWRRAYNEAWANCFLEPLDEDPEAWYKAFKELINSIRVSQGKDNLEDSESVYPTAPSRSSDGDVSEGSEDKQDEEDDGYATAEEGH